MPNSYQSRIADMLHLDEEDIALVAEAETPPPQAITEHLEICQECQQRVATARDIFCIEPLHIARAHKREAKLLDALTHLGAVEPSVPTPAVLRVVLEDGSLRVLHTTTEIRIRRQAVATRSAADVGTSGVAFFRSFGDVELEVHLIRVPTGRFHLVVGLMTDMPERCFRVALHRQDRQLAIEQAPHNTVTFKNLRPGSYRIEVQDRGVGLGQVEIDVEARYSPEGTS